MKTLSFAAVVRFALTLALAVGACGLAAAAPLVDAQLAVVMVVSGGRTETTAPAAAAHPGDVLEYTARYLNRGDAPAAALVPTLPIPVGTAWLATGAAPLPTQASLDGVTFAPLPLRRRVTGADGATREVDVPLAEVRALRWPASALAAGRELTVHARVRLAPPLVADR